MKSHWNMLNLLIFMHIPCIYWVCLRKVRVELSKRLLRPVYFDTVSKTCLKQLRRCDLDLEVIIC